MNEQHTFAHADHVLNEVVGKIRDDQWDMQMPADFPTSGDRTYTLRDIVDYQAYDEAWIPSIMAGSTIADVGEDAFGGPFDNELLSGDPAEQFDELVQKSVETVRALDEAVLDSRIVHYSYGDYPAREALWHATIFRAMRAHDIGKVIGLDNTLPDDLVQAVWDIVEPHAEEWREMGVFGPEVDVSEDQSLQDRLLGLTGRKP
jgi:hypothetical protein